ncbi:MAG TPA: DUF222 domain-containing protein [Candidatus Nanopelagicaceae bacterium]|nr:DUF222 domain-containing protein [Candidatus Nanopelagicaceae bacterium]
MDERSNTDEVSNSQVVLAVLEAEPGVRALAALVEINPLRLSATARIDYLAACERQVAWVQGLLNRALIAVAGTKVQESNRTMPEAWRGVDDAPRDEVAAALRLSSASAQRQIDTARILHSHLPGVRKALENGEIAPAHARVIVEESAVLLKTGVAPEIVAAVEARALSYAEFHTPSQLARHVRGQVAKAAVNEIEIVVASAIEARRITFYPEPDGMATIVALLPAADAQIVMLAVNALAKTESANATLGIDAKRADALTQIAIRALESVDNISAHRRPVSVNLTIDLPTLLGLADSPGELSGYGPIPASIARALAADGNWRRLITEPITGHLLEFGRESYQPPQALVDFLLARDRTCRFPGCRQPAQLGDIDHAIAWADGGRTDAANLGLLCRRHHRLKTHDGWSIESKEDGSCIWQSPTGHRYFVPARPVVAGAA